MAISVLLATLSLYVLIAIFMRLLAWADTAPPEVLPVKGLCGCAVDPYAGVHGHCRHKRARTPELVGISYVPRHAAA